MKNKIKTERQEVIEEKGCLAGRDSRGEMLGPEMGLGATDGKHFKRPSEKPGEDENRCILQSTKRRRYLTSAEKGKGTRLRKVNQGDNADYSLRGVTSGFVNRHLKVVINSTTWGILSRTWP
jgi:hypothetical protein